MADRRKDGHTETDTDRQMADRDLRPLLALDLTPKEREKDLNTNYVPYTCVRARTAERASTNTLVPQCPSLSTDRTSFVRSPQDPGAHPWVGLELDTARIQKHQSEAGTRKRKERPQGARPPQDESGHAGRSQVTTQPTLGASLGKEKKGCQSLKLLCTLRESNDPLLP